MKKITCFILSLLLATAAFADSSKFSAISHDELQTAVTNADVVVLDVNGTESYKSGHIPGAIDYIANQDRLASLLPADKEALVVAYCANERCGAYKSAAEAATKLGYKNVKHYAPGIAGWKKSGAPIEKS